jgi:NAD(P)-dependent dehydrogenase (short-subunit alcohol dehydrogenase family)
MSEGRQLAGRTALVTGASRGIGAAIAVALAAEGADVAVHFHTNRALALEVVRQCEAAGGTAMAAGGDLSRPETAAALRVMIKRELGTVDLLINNAGVGNTSIGRPLVAETTDEQFHAIFGPNVLGPLALCREFVPHMRGRAGAVVIFVSSIATAMLPATGGAYGASKAALEALAFTLAKEERQHGVRVNVVAPGLIDTDMGRAAVAAISGETDVANSAFATPLGFVAQPEDIANAVTFLCSPAARYITHTRVPVDGGLGW